MTTAVSAEDRRGQQQRIVAGAHALLLAIADHSIKDADEAFALLARRELKLVT